MLSVPFWLKAAIFLAMTGPIAFISWLAFKHRALLGISRFISYELTILLVVWNLEHLFFRPLSALGLCSWVLLSASLWLAVVGMLTIARLGKAELIIDGTTRLITQGVFEYVRHPLYASVLYLGLGFALKKPAWPQLVVWLVATVFLLIQVKLEEDGLVKQFGEPYRQYMKRVKRFAPWVI